MKQASTRSTSHETLSETPQVQKALYRLQQNKLRVATATLGDYLLLQEDLPATAKALLALADRTREQVLQLGKQEATVKLPAISLPADDRHLLSDAASHAPVVARRILRERIKEYEGRRTLLSALIVCVKGDALRAVLEAIAAEDEEDLASLCAMEKRLACS